MSETIDAAAARWFAAQDADDMDWDGFTAWLEADPRHGAAFDRLALLDDDIAAQAPAIRALLPANDMAADVDVAPPAPARRRWPVIGGTLAVAAAALALTIGLPNRTPDDRMWQTGATAQAVDVGEGVRVTIAPHSRLTARGGTQQLALQGAAYFDVAHREDRALAIAAGPVEIRDIGTRFDVSTDGRGVAQVAVAEGQVAVAAGALATPRTVVAGQRLSLIDGRVAQGRADPADVGGWRGGTLSYSDTPLALVAVDLSRYAGAGIRVAPSIADRRFSGALTVGDGSKLVEQVAAILDLRVVRDPAGVRLEPAR
ncbi:hypothetical protein ASE67_09505 [Sphingomonas sp. Leaf23]|uniref:FecR family protein n=1 Tax=Sphingomonas sp. Leaf23 TaxID=1735689 RepID=UPI0006F44A74|nr:FecR domain-containing protein [Sphingomonas sp. Leaf23]KQM86090.1 hypothetical protein ASE67_09505 [Sphingomonas sp. Leaf23]